MKFKLWREFGALNSTPVFDAFEHSLVSNGHTVTNSSDVRNADVHVLWSVLFNGRMTPNQRIWTDAKTFDKPVIVLEVGGIKRGTTWKVALNGINRDAYFGAGLFENNRSKKLQLKLKPWRTDGEYILICGQHDKSLQWQNMPRMSQWIMNSIEQIQQHTDRPIIFRPHPRCRLEAIEHQYKNVIRQSPRQLPGTYDDFDMRFDNIFCTVSWSSNPGIHSIISGVPSFVGPSSLAYDVAGHDLSDINNPPMPDREDWLEYYANTEYTLQEIKQGIPLKRLTYNL